MREIQELLDLMASLRDPESGCPWDRAQSYETLMPYTIEEAYEVADAISRNDWDELKNELGDLLFQVVFYAQLGREQNLFTFADIVRGITRKMTRRHPHVFGDTQYAGAAEQSRAWEQLKRDEQDDAIGGSALDGVALPLPGLTRAVKLTRKAARVGFDWRDAESVLEKIEEELGELRQELRDGGDHERLEDELGDLLFACANLARHMDVDPETAVRRSNAKFEARFRRIEAWLAETGRDPERASLAEMDRLWERAKAEERGERPPQTSPDRLRDR